MPVCIVSLVASLGASPLESRLWRSMQSWAGPCPLAASRSFTSVVACKALSTAAEVQRIFSWAGWEYVITTLKQHARVAHVQQNLVTRTGINPTYLPLEVKFQEMKACTPPESLLDAATTGCKDQQQQLDAKTRLLRDKCSHYPFINCARKGLTSTSQMTRRGTSTYWLNRSVMLRSASRNRGPVLYQPMIFSRAAHANLLECTVDRPA